MTSSQTSPPNLSVASARTLGLPNLAFVGKAGAGKSTAAELLQELGYRTLSFTTPIRRAAQDIWGPNAAADRSRLLALGDAVRAIDPDAWCNLLKIQLSRPNSAFGYVARDPEPVTVDDLRLENEWHMLKGEGFTIVRLKAPYSARVDRLKANGRWQDEAQLEHDTETAIDHLEADYVISNDGATTDLYDSIVDVILKERRRR